MNFLPDLYRLIIQDIGPYLNKPSHIFNSFLLKKHSKNTKVTQCNPSTLMRAIQKIKKNYGYYKERLKAEDEYLKNKDTIAHPAIVLEEKKKEDQLKDELKEQKKFVEHLLKENELKDKQLSVFHTLDTRLKRSFNIIPTRGIDSQAAAFLVGSDWHLEEKVDPSTVNGLNEFNISIAKDSVSNFFSNGRRLVEICQKDVHIDTVVLALIGDLINGYIHEEFLEDNYLSPIEASLLALDLVCSGVEYILKNSSWKLKIVCKFGNHGRTTLKRRVATSYKNSYEWMVYQLVAKEFQGNERVEVVVDNSYLTYIDVYGFSIRLHHGDNIGYQGGVGGVTIPLNKAIAQWDKHKHADLDVLGHFHQLQLDTGAFKYVMNGSIVGYNAYAVSIKAAFEEPKQAFFLIDSQRGKTISAPIFVRKLIS